MGIELDRAWLKPVGFCGEHDITWRPSGLHQHHAQAVLFRPRTCLIQQHSNEVAEMLHLMVSMSLDWNR